jgi:hypothetical protein
VAGAAPAGAQTAGSASPVAAQLPGSTGLGPVSRLPAPAVPTDPNALTRPARMDVPPVGHRLTGNQAVAIASKLPAIAAERRKHPDSYPAAFLKGPLRWQVSFYSRSPHSKEIAQVSIDDATGIVLEAWTGYKVAWTMARGYPGAFGRKANSLWVWIPLSVLFVLPFLNPRRPFRWLHLDLLVLVAFSASLAFFNHGRIDASVPLAYPPLVYLLARMLWIGLRRPRPGGPDSRPLRLLVPASWLAVAVVFLLGFRIGLNVTDSNVIDVGYAGVIGADRLTHGERLYGSFPNDNPHGDTYGPVTYEAYVPFEQALPWHGRWDDLPAAHAAAVAFDLLCTGLLFLLGRRVRGPTLGIALAYAWVAFPFTLFVASTNSNDALVAALLIAALLTAASAPARGALAALAGLTKVAPLALAPLFATHEPGRRRQLAFLVAFAAVGAVALLPVFLHDSLHDLYDRTVRFQATRGSPFSVWGLYGLNTLQHVVQGAAVALALAVAFLPRRRDVVGLGALGAAVLLALQLGVTHWFYLYIAWFFPLVMVALLGRHAQAGPSAPVSQEEGSARSRPLAVAASSG